MDEGTYNNSSGQGTNSEIPPEILKWNWAAAGLGIIWAAYHRVWKVFYGFIPVVGYFWWIVMGINGNKWAWQQNRWASVEEFQKIQRRWKPWGIIFLFLPIIIGVFAGIVVGSMNPEGSGGTDGLGSVPQTYTSSPVTMPSLTDQSTSTYDWIDFTPESKTFVVRLPSKPEHTTSTKLESDSSTTNLDFYVSKPDENDIYGLVETKLSAPINGSADVLLRGIVQGFVQSSGSWSLVSETPTGNGSRDYLIKNSDPNSPYRYIKGRVAIVKQTVYQLMVFYGQPDDASYAEFINSFRVK